MTKSGNKTWLLPLTLCIVSMIMGFLICGAYLITKDPIEQQATAAREAARRKVLPEAAELALVPTTEYDPVDYCYAGYDAQDNLIGYVCQVTVIGFGGEIEVTVGMDTSAAVTAINVGGSQFSETSGLGAKTKEPAFTDQFGGKSGLLVLKQNIDSVTGASISSGAVVGGVNQALNYMSALLPKDESASEEVLTLDPALQEQLLPGAVNLRYMGSAAGIDAWWQADNGYIVQALGFGRGPILVQMGFTPDGVCTGISIGDENFVESDGYGAKVKDEPFRTQFIGRSGVQVFGEGVDAVSGATSSSNGTLAAINACMSFDPAVAESEAAPAAVPASAEASAESDPEAASAVSEASITEEVLSPSPTTDAVSEASVTEEATPTPAPTPDAVTKTSVEEETASTPVPTAKAAPGYKPPASTAAVRAMPTPDAVSEASVEEATPTPAPTPDAVTEASVEE